MPVTLGEIADRLGLALRGDAGVEVRGVATLGSAGPDQISFLTNPKYRRQLGTTRAAAVILDAEAAAGCPVAALVGANPHAAYARVAALFERRPESVAGVAASAVVAADARLGVGVSIAANAVVEAGVELGDRVVIGPGCVVGEGVHIGADTRLEARVTVCHGVVIGARCLIHPGAVIGSDGFGLARDGGRWIKVPQLGGVRLGDDVEVGANTTIDRGALEDTVLEDGVKLDNLIQIAHNCRIGAHSALAGCVGIAGSSVVGRHCTLGGGVGLAGHLELADNVHVTGMSLVTKSITEPGVYASGLAVEPARSWNRISARLRQLEQLVRRIAALELTVKGQDKQ